MAWDDSGNLALTPAQVNAGVVGAIAARNARGFSRRTLAMANSTNIVVTFSVFGVNANGGSLLWSGTVAAGVLGAHVSNDGLGGAVTTGGSPADMGAAYDQVRVDVSSGGGAAFGNAFLELMQDGP